jgi:hypothetical protein
MENQPAHFPAWPGDAEVAVALTFDLDGEAPAWPVRRPVTPLAPSDPARKPRRPAARDAARRPSAG